MSVPTRPAMRLLSTRLHHLRRTAPFSPIRHVSRYSNPARRSFTAAPTIAPSFLDNEASHPLDPPRNPLDARAVQLAAEEKRQYHLYRMRFAGMGLLLSIVGLAVTVWNLDLDDMATAQNTPAAQAQLHKTGKLQLDASSEANASFQGKEVHIIGAGADKRILATDPTSGAETELVETGTSSVPHFPRTIFLPTDPTSDPTTPAAQPNSPLNAGNAQNQEEYTLLGLGIRTVSFLSIQVYVVGMYVRTQDISALQSHLIHSVNESASTLVPAEKAELEKRLMDPEQSTKLWGELLDVRNGGLKTAWRVAPTRNTDFQHLRDGWVTGINKRTSEAKRQIAAVSPAPGGESEYDSEAFGLAMKKFMGVFAGGKAPKGSVMILSRDRQGATDIFFQGKAKEEGTMEAVQHLGRVEDERIGRLIWMNYLAGDKVSSEAARKGVAKGCVSFAERPVGSVETRVT